MRIATSQIYSTSLKQINQSLNDVMDAQMKTSTQKKLNNISDNPSGAALSMQLQAYDATLTSYEENCALGENYLSTADNALVQASEIMMNVNELAEQGATETYTAEQLEMISIELRGDMDSLLQLSNTKLGEVYLFSGNDIENSAYTEGLGVTIDDPTIDQSNIVSVSGEADYTVYIQATETGVVGGTEPISYRYSEDGGNTWIEAELAAGETTLTAGDCSIELTDGTVLTEEDGSGEGTNLYIRPTMVYEGTSDPHTVLIGENSELEITSVGSDVFGGVDAETGEPYPEPNLAETMGDLIAYMETGNSEGVAECIESLNLAYEQMLQEAASIGTRENTAQNTASAIAITKDRNSSQISTIEDADATQLSVELAQAEYIYEAVLATSASVFELNLMNFL